ncbi:MAG TPA: LysM peptidoglycan-binding domain-containing protein [Halothiobacillus sp.]|nr:LysM peptidoglycan-binding domain-containing protein [Halothiobacillus sp.]
MNALKGFPVALAVTALLSSCASVDNRAPFNIDAQRAATSALPATAERPSPVLDAKTAESRFRSLHTEDYVVRKGDTLWDIANHFLKNPLYWPEIWHNNQQITNPHLIFPGDTISIVYVDGVPRLTVSLSPRMRSEDVPVPVLPLDMLRPFLSYDQVLNAEDFDAAPYILRGRDPRILIATNDTVYARPALNESNDRYAVLRPGSPLVDPETGEVLGIHAIYHGEVSVIERGDPNVLNVDMATRGIRQGDRLSPMLEESFTRDVVPSIPTFDIRGQVIYLPDALSYVGRNQVVVINQGEIDGLRVGDMLEIREVGGVVEDVYSTVEDELYISPQDEFGELRVPEVKGPLIQLPDVPIGALLVFRTYDRVSYGLVLKSERPIRVGDKVLTPTD